VNGFTVQSVADPLMDVHNIKKKMSLLCEFVVSSMRSFQTAHFLNRPHKVHRGLGLNFSLRKGVQWSQETKTNL